MEQISNDGSSLTRSLGEALSLLSNDGQIKYDSGMGRVIAQYAQDTRFTNYLEIGTWNGGGSTYCFAKGFESRTDPFFFLTLEVNRELYDIAKEKYSAIPYVYVEHGSIISSDMVKDKNSLLEPFESVNIEWLKDDIRNVCVAKHIEFVDTIPEVVLLDGSEYLTYFEFLKLQDTTKVFILDDINTEKCKKIVKELDSSELWICKHKVTSERNGWAVYEKIVV
jgi:hypothetical protein